MIDYEVGMNDLLIYVAMAISVLSNIILTFLWIKNKKSKQKLKDSRELNDFILDLMNGEGLVKVSRVDPANIMIRSPRG
jgi:ABC-type bacteriocin/lantibiotic exporter with double-glycine peptidase domain